MAWSDWGVFGYFSRAYANVVATIFAPFHLLAWVGGCALVWATFFFCMIFMLASLFFLCWMYGKLTSDEDRDDNLETLAKFRRRFFWPGNVLMVITIAAWYLQGNPEHVNCLPVDIMGWVLWFMQFAVVVAFALDLIDYNALSPANQSRRLNPKIVLVLHVMLLNVILYFEIQDKKTLQAKQQYLRRNFIICVLSLVVRLGCLNHIKENLAKMCRNPWIMPGVYGVYSIVQNLMVWREVFFARHE